MHGALLPERFPETRTFGARTGKVLSNWRWVGHSTWCCDSPFISASVFSAPWWEFFAHSNATFVLSSSFHQPAAKTWVGCVTVLPQEILNISYHRSWDWAFPFPCVQSLWGHKALQTKVLPRVCRVLTFIPGQTSQGQPKSYITFLSFSRFHGAHMANSQTSRMFWLFFNISEMTKVWSVAVAPTAIKNHPAVTMSLDKVTKMQCTWSARNQVENPCVWIWLGAGGGWNVWIPSTPGES